MYLHKFNSMSWSLYCIIIRTLHVIFYSPQYGSQVIYVEKIIRIVIVILAVWLLQYDWLQFWYLVMLRGFVNILVCPVKTSTKNYIIVGHLVLDRYWCRLFEWYNILTKNYNRIQNYPGYPGCNYMTKPMQPNYLKKRFLPVFS